MYVDQAEWDVMANRVTQVEEALKTGVGSYSISEFQRKLEPTWNPNGNIFLGAHSVGPPALATVPHTLVYRANNQTLTTAVDTPISWDTELYDTNAMFALSAPTRITCRVDGLYIISAGMSYAANATGYRVTRIRLNGSTVVAADESASAGAVASTSLTLSLQRRLVAGDYLELYALQGSGGNLAALAGQYTFMAATWHSNTA